MPRNSSRTGRYRRRARPSGERVLTAPSDLGRDELTAELARGWGFRCVTLEYLPVGFGSHHWQATDARGLRRFVTVDDLEAGFQAGSEPDAAFAAMERAFATAAFLRDEAELEFVVAPLLDEAGAVIRRLTDRYALTVLPFVQGTSGAFGSYESADDRRRVGGLLGRLHAATEHVPPSLPRTEEFAIPSRDVLLRALDHLDRPWSTGPFAEPARQQLRAAAREIATRLEQYDELVGEVRASSGSWVLTHGEPHSANVLRSEDDRLYLVDWDTTLIAPRERDLRMVLDGELTGWDDYVAAGRAASLNEEAMQLYRLWWDLSEIATYADLFRRPHERTADTVASWGYFMASLPKA